MYNQYDLSKIYGFPESSTQMLPGGTLQNTLTDRIPSIQEIAQYNTAQQQMPQSVINVPQILGGNALQGTESGGVTALRPAPERLDTIPVTQDVIQGTITTPAGGIGAEANDSIEYLNGLIRTQIGRRASIDFLLGTSGMVTKDGYILGVGSNYILINEVDTDDITACDFYNIKFIKFFY